jgi:hypothetical protein
MADTEGTCHRNVASWGCTSGSCCYLVEGTNKYTCVEICEPQFVTSIVINIGNKIFTTCRVRRSTAITVLRRTITYRSHFTIRFIIQSAKRKFCWHSFTYARAYEYEVITFTRLTNTSLNRQSLGCPTNTPNSINSTRFTAVWRTVLPEVCVSMNKVPVLYGPPEYHLFLYVPMSNKCHIPIRFLTITCMHFSFLTCLLRAPYNPLFDYCNSIWWMVEIMKTLLLQISLSHLCKVSKSCHIDGCTHFEIYKYVTQQYASIQLYAQKTCTYVTTVMSERCC